MKYNNLEISEYNNLTMSIKILGTGYTLYALITSMQSKR